jgi:hypothetical protein
MLFFRWASVCTAGSTWLSATNYLGRLPFERKMSAFLSSIITWLDIHYNFFVSASGALSTKQIFKEIKDYSKHPNTGQVQCLNCLFWAKLESENGTADHLNSWSVFKPWPENRTNCLTTVGIRIPDKSAIQMVHLSKNWASGPFENGMIRPVFEWSLA